MAKVRNTGTEVVPVGGGLAVAPGQVVEVPDGIARRLVATPRFESVGRRRGAPTSKAAG